MTKQKQWKDDALAKSTIGGRSVQEMVDDVRKKGTLAEPNQLRQSLLRNWGIRTPSPKADTVVFLSCYVPTCIIPEGVRRYFMLLKHFGIDATFLDRELCCGVPIVKGAQSKEDREIAGKASREFIETNLNAAKKTGARNAVCICTWCAFMYKKHFPDSYIPVMNYPDIFLDKVAKERLRVKPRTVVYFEGCHRFANAADDGFAPGVTLDNFDKYREVANSIEGLKIVTIPGDLCCMKMPELIIQKAKDLGAGSILTPCASCLVRLGLAGKGTMPTEYFSDVLFEALGIEQPPLTFWPGSVPINPAWGGGGPGMVHCGCGRAGGA